MNEDKVVLLLHLDHGEGEHSYTLLQVPVDRLEEAKSVVRKAWDDYDGNDRQGWWDELLDTAMKASGIPCGVLDYDPLLIMP